MPKYHISPTTKAPAPCEAKRCPFATAINHYGSVEEAENAIQERKILADKVSQQIKKQKSIFSKLSPTEKDRVLRDKRQGNTVYDQLVKEGISDEEITVAVGEEVKNREAGIALLSVNGDPDASPVIGVSYGGDSRAEEEYGLSAISKALEAGKELNVTLEETKDGLSVLTIPNPESLSTHSIYGDEQLKRAHDQAIKRFRNPYVDIPWSEQSKIYGMKIPELRESLKGHVKPLPTKRAELELAYKKTFLTKDFIPPSVGEFHSGHALTIVADKPAMKAILRKTKEAAEAKTLRMGSSANPFSRGVVFYDERDLSRGHKDYAEALDNAQKNSMKRIDTIQAKMSPKDNGYGNGGRLHAIRSDAGIGTKPGEEKYFINYSLPNRVKASDGKSQIFGWFTKEELEKISEGDYSPYEEQETARKNR